MKKQAQMQMQSELGIFKKAIQAFEEEKADQSNAGRENLHSGFQYKNGNLI
jgi:hypothetical protein